MKKKRINCFITGCLFSLTGFAQTDGYRFTAEIEKVNESGFYNILFTPALKAHLKKDYSDLRIINTAGKWVPHLLRYPKGEQTNHNVLYDLQIVKQKEDLVSSEIIVKALAGPLSNFTILTRNTDVERFGILTGSDDSTSWFVINDSVLIKPVASTPNESKFSFHFRPNTYRFYKLTILNKGKAPYAIKAATTEAAAFEEGSNQSLLMPVKNPAPTIVQQDSATTSYIKVSQKEGYHVDEVELSLSGSHFFNRDVRLFIPAPGREMNLLAGNLIASFVISSNNSLRFSVPVFKEPTFYIAIDNEDNLPLKVEAVTTYSKNHIATVYLEKNNRYAMIMGNETATIPRYDLQAGDIDVKKILPVVATGKVSLLPVKEPAAAAWYNNKWTLWIFIAAAASILCFFTFRLIKEMGGKKEPLT